MAKFHAPEALDFSKPDEWPEWKGRFHRYRIATKLNKEENEIQVSALVYSMGRQAESIFNCFGLNAADQKDFDKVLQKFDAHFTPARNTIHERAMFHQRCQKQGESVEQFVRSLYEMSENCDFTNKDEQIRDRIVVGICDRQLAAAVSYTHLTLPTKA